MVKIASSAIPWSRPMSRSTCGNRPWKWPGPSNRWPFGTLRQGVAMEGPSGSVSLDPRNQHLSKRCRIGRIRFDRQFDIVFKSYRMLSPNPFPQDAFPGWRCDWTRGGLVEGPAVDIES